MAADFQYNEDEAMHTWLGEYRKQADNAIYSRVSVKNAMERKVSTEGDYSVGIDPARFGSDFSVITIRKGLQVLSQKEYKHLDGVHLADEYEKLVEYRKDVCTKIDGGGCGASVIDVLKSRGYRKITEVNFGEKAMDTDRYDSAASEMWFGLDIANIGIPNDDELLQQLSDRRYSYNNKTQKVVEKKDDYKKRHSGKSPDKADSLLLCFYERHTPKIALY